MIMVKLGGSVITDKNKLRRFRKTACARLCGELRPAKDDLILVHGAGSFGHILVKKWNLESGVPDGSIEDLRHVAIVHRDVKDLDSKVFACLASKRLRGYSVPPHTVASFSDATITAFCPEKFEMLLENEMIPVTFGDMVPDRELKFAVCSGDLLMVALAKHFKPTMTVFVADVDGIYDKDPKEFETAKLVRKVTPDNMGSIVAGSGKNDVTGGMGKKLASMMEIAEHCENTIILNGNAEHRLERALKGERVVATKVVA